MPSNRLESTPGSENSFQLPGFLLGSGKMRALIRHFNWGATPIGEVAYWKQSFKSALSICLNSNFPIAIYWGADLTLLYNDAWSPIPGNKSPWALGRPAKEVWPEIWEEIGPQFKKAFNGEAGGSKDALLPMLRHGYTEECYFDFTFTPVYGEEGEIDGIFNAVIETTFQIIHERRARFLHTLSGKISYASSGEEVYRIFHSFLKSHPEDLPFCYLYTTNETGESVSLVMASNENVPDALPFIQVAKTGQPELIKDLTACFKKIPVNHWPESPAEAMLVPLKGNNGNITGYLFAGLSARRRFDQEYQIFIEGVAAALGAALNSIDALEEERKRVAILDEARRKVLESEAAIRRATNQMELAFQNVPAAIYLFDKEGTVLFLNNQAARLHGWNTAAEGLAEISLNGFHDRSADVFEIRDENGRNFSMSDAPTTHTLRTGQPTQKIIQLIRRSDHVHQWILIKTAPLLDDRGELTMVLNCTTDITVQKEAETKIRESEENFRTLTQALPQLVWVTDPFGKQQFVTERWKEYTGLDPLDINTWAMILHPDDVNVLAKAWNESLEMGNTYKAEARLKSKDGHYRWFYVHGEPILSEENKITKWVGAFTDIHEQKTAEEKLRQNEEKLEYLVKKRTEELERSNEDLQQFAHVASHDLKEPIRKIKVFSGLLQEEFAVQINEKARLYLSKIQSASDRMLLMMEGVLRYAGLDGYQQGYEEVDLNKIIQSVRTDLEMVIQNKHAQIACDELPTIQGYSVLIYQLFYNLISNALKFSKTDAAPFIQIQYNKEIRDHKNFARLMIRDNGIGFEQANAEKIFYTFARLNPKEDYEGTGLGLSLSKKIVLRHHGIITAKGEPEIGAEFNVLLPFLQTEPV